MTHLSTDELERYALGQVTADADLERIEEHILACPGCAEAAQEAEGYVGLMQTASANVTRQGGAKTMCNCPTRQVESPPFDDWSKRFSGEQIVHTPECVALTVNAFRLTPEEITRAEQAIAELGMDGQSG